MSTKFKRWARRAGETLLGTTQSRELYPILPAERPRPLTAICEPASPLATSSSPLFALLPYDIRRLILIETFGDRTMHIDLRFGHPILALPADKISQQHARHCGFGHDDDELQVPTEYELDISRPERWIWHGSVCHRNREVDVRGDGVLYKDPFMDGCVVAGGRRRTYCGDWSGDMPGKCYPGAMGWLLTCRQAYTEGIDVLYATNCFHIHDLNVLHMLPKLIPQQRVSSMTSLELVHRGTVPMRVAYESFHTALLRITQAAPEMFPNLRKIHIVAEGSWLHPDPGSSWPALATRCEAEVFLAVEDMIVKLPRLEDCLLTVPNSVFSLVFRSARAKGRPWDHRAYYVNSVWRPLVACGKRNSQRIKGEGDEPDFRYGFWIVCGSHDLPQKGAGQRGYWPEWEDNVPIRERDEY